jgi:hypothetical protein
LSAKERIKSRTGLFPFAPRLPSGSLIYTALVLAHRSGSHKGLSSSVNRLYDFPSLNRINLFGAGADHIAKNYFSDILSSDQVLRQHSLFGFYALGLGNFITEQWSKQLRDGRATLSRSYTKTQGLITPNIKLRWCKECACSDQAERGFTAWRVVHQLPFVSRCPVHHSPLFVCCDDCQSPLDTGNQFRLPGENCGVCGSSNFTALPQIENQGYRSLISLCEAVIRTQSNEFKPQVWVRRINRFVNAQHSLDVAVAILSDRICKKWDVQTPDDITDVLALPLGRNYVTGLLAGNLSMYPLVAQIIVSDAMHDDGAEDADSSASITNASYMSREGDRNSDADIHCLLLREVFVDLGFPPALLGKLLSDMAVDKAARSCGVAASQIYWIKSHPECGPIIARARVEAEERRKILQKSKRISVREERRAIYRQLVTKWINELPGFTRTEARRKFPEVTAWLFRCDRKWFNDILPQQRPGRKR